jgi:hypothetical protein
MNAMNREEMSSIFGLHDNCPLMSHIETNNRTTPATSAMHHDGVTDSKNGDKKPEIVTYYNCTVCSSSSGSYVHNSLCVHWWTLHDF